MLLVDQYMGIKTLKVGKAVLHVYDSTPNGKYLIFNINVSY